jgi:hypothetical protein
MRVDLGPVTVLGADVITQTDPPQFRLFAQSHVGSVVMWLEKEQMDGLSAALDRSLVLLTEVQVLRTEVQVSGRQTPQGLPANFPRSPDYECQVGQMRLTFYEHDSSFLLNIVPLEVSIEQKREPQVYLHKEDTLLLTFTQRQAQNLSSSIRNIISVGDPICPFCRKTLERQPHTCVKQNGHKAIIHILEDEDEGL